MRGDFPFKRRKPSVAERIRSENPMHITSRNPAIGAYRAFGAAILEVQERPRERFAFGFANMHLVAFERRAASGAAHPAQRLPARERGGKIEIAEAGTVWGGPSMPSGSEISRPSIWKPPQSPSTRPPRRTWAARSMSQPSARKASRSAMVASSPATGRHRRRREAACRAGSSRRLRWVRGEGGRDRRSWR